jgi:chromosome segregation ATPase
MTARLPLVLVALFLGATAAPAQSAKTESGSDVSVELAKLNKAVREIADALAKQAAGQKLDLLMKRIELSSSRIGEGEQRLRTLKSETAKAEDEKRKLETEIEMVQAHLESQPDQTRKPERDAFFARGEADLKRLASKLQSLAQETGEAEAALATQREELRQWQGFVDRALTSF